jgi:hypothetical protein
VHNEHHVVFDATYRLHLLMESLFEIGNAVICGKRGKSVVVTAPNSTQLVFVAVLVSVLPQALTRFTQYSPGKKRSSGLIRLQDDTVRHILKYSASRKAHRASRKAVPRYIDARSRPLTVPDAGS